MSEIISCPSCHRQLQVPESLLGQDVQCPTCSATFVGSAAGARPSAPSVPVGQAESAYAPPGARPLERADQHNRPAEACDYEEDRYPPRRRRDLAPHRASTVLVLGILSLVICGVGLVLGIIAWAMGQNDLKEMRAGRMDPDGEATTNAGRICGIIGTCLSAAAIVFWVLYMVFVVLLISSLA